MNTISKWAMTLSMLWGTVYGQAPSTNDTSDNNRTASGLEALYSNTAGSGNTATGFEAFYSNMTGSGNTATGWSALQQNTTGNNNTASGVEALNSNTTGSFNTAVGAAALAVHTTGSSNIALGYEAGYNLKTGSFNIEIGNRGAATDHKTIKIGTEGTQAKTFVAGIYNVPLTGNAVVVTSTGQLGVAAVSSERFKTAIEPMGANTDKLQQLRPVSFHLKTDPNGAVQYGLIAEEVAKVYPELVIRDEKGRIDGVRYEELAPMLLNEVQKEHATVAAQAAEIRDLKQGVAKVNDMERELAEMHAELTALQSKNQLVAQR